MYEPCAAGTSTLHGLLLAHRSGVRGGLPKTNVAAQNKRKMKLNSKLFLSVYCLDELTPQIYYLGSLTDVRVSSVRLGACDVACLLLKDSK